MDVKDEIREFLMSRRANVRPEHVGLPAHTGDRRVPGLRREEVAVLAGVSSDYYTRLERGHLRGASESVLNAIATALCLNDVERRHLFDLARATTTTVLPKRPEHPLISTIQPSIRRVLDGLRLPGVVYNIRQDILAANPLGRALFAPIFDSDRPNFPRFIFRDPRAKDFYDDWPLSCSLSAALLRFEVGRDPLNPALTELVGELSTLSPVFRRHWADQDVHEHRTGRKLFHHPDVGPLDITFDVLEVPGEPGLSLAAYSPADDGPTEERLELLGSLHANDRRDVGV